MKRSIMQLSNDAKFRLAVHSALVAGLSTGGIASAQEAAPAPTDEKATELEEIVVTGSHITRAGLEGALPVTVIERAQIDMSGQISVAEFLRNISLNTFGSLRQQSGSSAQGIATIDLRGLGAERTLILIDGKRAPKSPYYAAAQDLNSVPMAAVERIEILQDGASAIYGSDAIAGVINIILRRDFQGTQVHYGFGDTEIAGGNSREAGLVMGMPTASGNIVFGASYNFRDIVFARSLVSAGIDAPGSSLYGNNYVTPADNFASVNAVPGGCGASNAFFIANGTAVNSQVDLNGDGQNDLCRYDFNQVAADEASADNMGLFAKGRFAINKDWNFYTTASVSRARSFGRYAPAPALLFVPGEASGIDHDGDGTDDDVYVYHRFDALGTRDDTVNGNVYDMMVGFDGHVEDVKLDTGIRYNEFKVFTIGRNYVVNPIASQLATAGDYNFRDPLDNDATTLSQMKATLARESTWNAKEGWANASISMFNLPGGTGGLAVGVDYYKADYLDQYDSLSEGGVIGGSAGNTAGTDRSITGYYTEVYLPVVEKVEVSAAIRFDKYSDFDTTEDSPKISVGYQPIEQLKLRAAYGQGFRAPTMDVISQEPSFSAEPVVNDSATCIAAGGTFADGECDVTVQVDTTIIANPSLAPEESDQLSFGAVYEPVDYIDFSLDYYQYKVTDLIAYISPSDLIDLQNQGESLPPGLSIVRNPSQSNRITDVVAGYANRGELTTDGLNFNVNFRWDFGPVGRLTSGLNLAYVLGWELDTVGRDQVNDPGYPEYRFNWNTTYGWRELTFAWNQTYIASQATDVTSTGTQSGDSGEWWTHDLQLNYDMPRNFGAITVGMLNATDEKPPQYEYDGRPYNFYLYNSYGATPYMRYTLRFQ